MDTYAHEMYKERGKDIKACPVSITCGFPCRIFKYTLHAVEPSVPIRDSYGFILWLLHNSVLLFHIRWQYMCQFYIKLIILFKEVNPSSELLLLHHKIFITFILSAVLQLWNWILSWKYIQEDKNVPVITAATIWWTTIVDITNQRLYCFLDIYVSKYFTEL